MPSRSHVTLNTLMIIMQILTMTFETNTIEYLLSIMLKRKLSGVLIIYENSRISILFSQILFVWIVFTIKQHFIPITQ